MASPYDKFYAQNLEQSTAGKPFIQQDVDVQKEHESNIENTAMLYARQNAIPYDQAKNLINARWENQQKQKAFAVADETRNLNAHNDALDAGMALKNIEITSDDAADNINKIKASISKHSGTKEAEPIFAEAQTMLDKVRQWQTTKRAEKREELAQKTAEQRAYRESPTGQAEVAAALEPIKVSTAIKERQASEAEAEKMLKAKEEIRKNDPLFQAKQRLSFNREARDVGEQIKSTLAPYGLTERSFSLPSIETDAQGRPAKGGGYVVLTDMVKNKKIKSNPIAKESFEDARSRYSDLSQQRQDLYTAYQDVLPQKEKQTMPSSLPSTEPSVSVPSTEVVPEPMVESVEKPTQAKGFSNENPFTEFVSTTAPTQETITEQTRRLNPKRVQQETDENVVNAANEVAKIEEEANKAKEMGVDKYKELYGIDPASYAIKWEKANNKMKDALARSIFEEVLKTTPDRKKAAQKANQIAIERGYQF